MYIRELFLSGKKMMQITHSPGHVILVGVLKTQNHKKEASFPQPGATQIRLALGRRETNERGCGDR